MDDIAPKSTTEFCYEYFGCREFGCIRRKKLELYCWEVEDVKCKSHSP